MTRHLSRRSFVVGLLGQGVGPSLTPEMHEREAARRGLRYAYKAIDLRPDQIEPAALARLIGAAQELGFDGLNVTHPVKQRVLGCLDTISETAAAIGAVNTIVFDEAGSTGHNTDVSGFAAALTSGLIGARVERVVLLGAGGAGAAVAHALAGHGTTELTIVDHDTARATRLADSIRQARGDCLARAAAPAEVADSLTRADGLVNATPVGMSQHPGTPIDPDLLDAEHWIADIVYRPLETAFLAAARDRGCRVMSGAGMAVHQAADAFELITHASADRAAMSADFDELVAEELAATPAFES